MKRTELFFLILLAAPAAGLGRQKANTEWIAYKGSFSFRVLVYNYAHVRPDVLTRAQKVTSEIFDDAGISLVWTNCRSRVDGVPGESSCQPPYGPTDFFLRILPHGMSSRLASSKTALGLALVSEGEYDSRFANILYDRIQDLAAFPGLVDWRLLALATAHELGHLMLPQNGHSGGGIMRTNWTPLDVGPAASASMIFTHAESQLMQEELAWRVGRRWSVDPVPALVAKHEAGGRTSPAGSWEDYALQYDYEQPHPPDQH